MSQWWASPGAKVQTARIAHDVTVECPECGKTHEGELVLYFPSPQGKVLGFKLACGCTLDAGEFDVAIEADDQIESGFHALGFGDAGTHPVTLVDDESGNKDIIPFKVMPRSPEKEAGHEQRSTG